MYTNENDEGFLTPREVARDLRVSLPTAYRYLARGQLRGFRLGEDGPLRVPASAVEEFLTPAARAASPEDV